MILWETFSWSKRAPADPKELLQQEKLSHNNPKDQKWLLLLSCLALKGLSYVEKLTASQYPKLCWFTIKVQDVLWRHLLYIESWIGYACLGMSPMKEFLVNAGCRNYSSQLSPLKVVSSLHGQTTQSHHKFWSPCNSDVTHHNKENNE